MCDICKNPDCKIPHEADHRTMKTIYKAPTPHYDVIFETSTDGQVSQISLTKLVEHMQEILNYMHKPSYYMDRYYAPIDPYTNILKKFAKKLAKDKTNYAADLFNKIQKEIEPK